MRLAVLNQDRCYPQRCSQECITFCPRVRGGDETIFFDEEAGKPVISPELCAGCGICVHKCPFGAIHIENLAEELSEDMIHCFGENDFHLFRLPVPRPGKVVGILGKNGIGKTTAINILSGQIVPNLGNWTEVSVKVALTHWKGTEMYDYLQRLFSGDLNIAFKSQYVDELSHRSGTVTDFISPKIAKIFGLDKILNRKMSHLSGGELQQIAIAETLYQEADIYFFDEPSSYLDIDRRIFMARNIRELTKQNKMVMVVEHDLGVLDFLADLVHLIYGTKSVYGVVTQPKSVRHGINLYLSGYLKEENIRFGEEITFEVHPPSERNKRDPLLLFERLTKSFDAFTLNIAAGELCRGDVIGVVGPNAIGKTTFVKMLASSIEPTQGEVNAKVTVSYKPQYLRPIGGRVQDIFLTVTSLNPFYERKIIVPLGIDVLYDKKVKDLSGGELQSVAIALCLARQADIYLIDEPSAYLDANQRMNVAKVIKRIVQDQEVAALVVDHDVYFIDLVSQSLMVFTGDPEVWGKGQGPYDLRTGMNIFLKELDVTFRRDEDSNRPRVNKPGSRLDREQRRTGEYYYEPLE